MSRKTRLLDFYFGLWLACSHRGVLHLVLGGRSAVAGAGGSHGPTSFAMLLNAQNQYDEGEDKEEAVILENQQIVRWDGIQIYWRYSQGDERKHQGHDQNIPVRVECGCTPLCKGTAVVTISVGIRPVCIDGVGVERCEGSPAAEPEDHREGFEDEDGNPVVSGLNSQDSNLVVDDDEDGPERLNRAGR